MKNGYYLSLISPKDPQERTYQRTNIYTIGRANMPGVIDVFRKDNRHKIGYLKFIDGFSVVGVFGNDSSYGEMSKQCQNIVFKDAKWGVWTIEQIGLL